MPARAFCHIDGRPAPCVQCEAGDGRSWVRAGWMRLTVRQVPNGRGGWKLEERASRSARPPSRERRRERSTRRRRDHSSDGEYAAQAERPPQAARAPEPRAAKESRGGRKGGSLVSWSSDESGGRDGKAQQQHADKDSSSGDDMITGFKKLHRSVMQGADDVQTAQRKAMTTKKTTKTTTRNQSNAGSGGDPPPPYKEDTPKSKKTTSKETVHWELKEGDLGGKKGFRDDDWGAGKTHSTAANRLF